MAVLVTGGAGFIGSHLVEELVRRGENVIVVDNFSSGKAENIVDVKDKIELVNCDIREKEIEDVFKAHDIDVVAHLAAQIEVEKSLEDPKLDADVNLMGSINLFELCRRYDVNKIVFTSSIAVYGEPRYLPVDEKHELAPISPYGCAKLAVEKYLHYYWRVHGIDYIALRLANVYGPRQKHGVIPAFITNLLRGERVVIYGDGKQTRDFVFVDDVINAILLALEKETRHKCMNIATCKETSIIELLGLISEKMGVKAEPEFLPERKEIRRCYFSYNIARVELKWEPKVELAEGIEKTIEWFKKTGR